MADVWYKTGTFTTPASGTTVISTTDKGTNPKAIHLWWTHADTNDTNELGVCFGHGFGDGTDETAMCLASQHNGSVNRRHGIGTIAGTGNCIAILNPASITTTTSGTLFVIGTTAAMNVNDVTITYTTFTAGIIVHYEIWGGADCSANMTIRNADPATDSPFTHSLGATPDLILQCTLGQAHPANAEFAFMAFGAAHDNGASIDQWMLSAYLGDNNETDTGSAITPAMYTGQYDLEYADWDNTITVIGATTFTWTAGTGSSGMTDDVIDLYLDFSGVGVDVGTFTKSTGGAPVTQALPNLGFTPLGYHLATANNTGTGRTTQTEGHMAHGAYDGSTGHAAAGVQDNGNNTDRASRSITGEVLFGSADLDVSGVQFSGTPQAITDATPDVEWNPNTASAVHIGYYAVEDTNLTLTASGTPSIDTITASGTAILAAQHEQDSFGFYNDGTEAGATTLAAQNVDISIGKEETFQLRVGGQLTGDPDALSATLQYKKTGDADSEFRDVP